MRQFRLIFPLIHPSVGFVMRMTRFLVTFLLAVIPPAFAHGDEKHANESFVFFEDSTRASRWAGALSTPSSLTRPESGVSTTTSLPGLRDGYSVLVTSYGKIYAAGIKLLQ